MIETKNVTKIYKNGFQAVTNLNLKIEKGDVFGFLGPNGAGKTTTIRMLDGLLEPTSGEILVNGIDIRENQTEIKNMVGVVPESHGYYYWMTAKEYLQYFNSLFHNQNVDDQYIDYLLQRVGLYEKRDVIVGQFSRGMKQRLGIAKALINKPEIIFLDEPTLGLDPRGQKEIQQLLSDINKNEKITIFITSHMLKDIEVMCNKVCIIQNGVLVEQGSIQELQKKYLTHYTLLIETDDNEKAIDVLSEIEEIRQIDRCNEKLEVKFVKDLSEEKISNVKQKMIHKLYESGMDMKEMSVKTLSMEDIFFRATEKEA
ncbi:ABC transporter ATP-binding protein [Haloimpatiens lingqiaonensis]|uniref:ABC transporter ATP-binding protein n=1 Tax=Haloimpatiens lingqiaonensis TaxID=1380675 RepID=UPI0010FE1D5B|nr:ABC transporter ATP-binding protein [Haloimpatiens lingqiaonensis]MDD4432114.1 ABC transporter ATP-binding protein [Parabacteroides sp.]